MLPERVRATLTEIAEGEPFPAVWLATRDLEAGARVRTVLLSHWEESPGRLYLGSDVRHRKREELQADPVGEVCVVRIPGGPMQLRFRCRFRILGGHEPDEEPLRRLWARVAPRDRVRFYGAETGDGDPSPDFLGLEGEIVEIDLLDLRPDPPCRFHYRRFEGEWVEETLLV